MVLDMEIYSKFFRKNLLQKFDTSIQDYSLVYVDNFSTYDLHKDLIQENRMGLILKYRDLDSAILSFNREGSVLDCTQIQGGRRRFKELAPVFWHNILLGGLVNMVLDSDDVSEVKIIPSYLIEDFTPGKNPERFTNIYDLNAKMFGFSHDVSLKRYVKTF